MENFKSNSERLIQVKELRTIEQCNAVMDFLQAYGFDTSKLTVAEMVSINSDIKSIIFKHRFPNGARQICSNGIQLSK